MEITKIPALPIIIVVASSHVSAFIANANPAPRPADTSQIEDAEKMTNRTEEEIASLHEKTSPHIMSYLKMLKAGDVFGATRVSYLVEGQTEEALRSALEQVYRMSTMSKWDIVAGWPFFAPDGTSGFVYRIKVSYPESYYFVLTGVATKDNRSWIVGAMAPENLWPEVLRTPSIEDSEKFSIGKVE